jgi:hypothetical protein
LVQLRIQVDRVPQHDDVDHEAKRAEPLFLTPAIALAQFAALAVKHHVGAMS